MTTPTSFDSQEPSEIPKIRSETPGLTDRERLVYLAGFVPDEHLRGMQAFVNVYAGKSAVAKEKLTLACLEGWCAAINWVLEFESDTPDEEEAENEEGETGVKVEPEFEGAVGQEESAGRDNAERTSGDVEGEAGDGGGVVGERPNRPADEAGDRASEVDGGARVRGEAGDTGETD